MTRPLAAAALALALAAPAAAFEHTAMEPMWLRAGPDGPPLPVPALLNTPPGWLPGDTAVILIADWRRPEERLEGLTWRLLDHGAAVLELDVASARGVSPESATPMPRLTAAALLPDLRAAVAALRVTARAGTILAIGSGAGGVAALVAAETAMATGDGPAVGVAVSATGLRFATAGAEDRATRWAQGVPAVCAALSAMAAAPREAASARAREAASAAAVGEAASAAQATCRRALAPAGPVVVEAAR